MVGTATSVSEPRIEVLIDKTNVTYSAVECGLTAVTGTVRRTGVDKRRPYN
jgi:hypothetical protein